MNEALQAMTNDLLTLHKEAVNWSLEQSKLAEKQMNSVFDTARASARVSRDLTQSAAKTVQHAAFPGEEA